MTQKVVKVSGNKIQSLLAGDNGLMFSSQVYDSPDDFMEAWKKKITLATKVDIRYSTIKSITKEDGDTKILIRYKAILGLPSDCEFSFTDNDEYESFYNYLEREQYFSKVHETLTPVKAITRYVLGLLITLAITGFAYWQALNLKNGTDDNSSSGKVQLFNFLIELIGDKGVLIIGGGIICYILYKIVMRFKNPPSQLRFIRPNM